MQKTGGGGDDAAQPERGLGTRAVHAGENQQPPFPPAVTPIFQTAPFAFSSAQQLADGFDRPEQDGLYSRYANPTVQMVEDKLAALEGAEAAVAFASGMAAISTTLGTLLSTGDRLLAATELYGGTSAWLAWLTAHHPGVTVERVPLAQIAERLEEGVATSTCAVYVETPGNPLLDCCDLRRVGGACQRLGVPLVVDNTFATPVLQRPLELGAALVVHSATKYLGGHSDLSAGLAAGSRLQIEPIRAAMRLGGGCLDPHAAFLLARGMRTLALRVERQSANAARLATLLRRHPAVDRVFYPDDAVARAQMSAGGGMVSFEVAGGLPAANKVLDRLQIARIMASLGGTETSAVLPAVTSHKKISSAEREAQGIRDGLIRLSVGIEDIADLEADLEQALAG